MLCKLLIVGGSKGYFIPPFTKCELLKSLCCWKRKFDQFYLWSACVCVCVCKSVCKANFLEFICLSCLSHILWKISRQIHFQNFLRMWFYKWLGKENFFRTLNFVSILIHFINLSLILQDKMFNCEFCCSNLCLYFCIFCIYNISFSNSLNFLKENFW